MKKQPKVDYIPPIGWEELHARLPKRMQRLLQRLMEQVRKDQPDPPAPTEAGV